MWLLLSNRLENSPFDTSLIVHFSKLSSRQMKQHKILSLAPLFLVLVIDTMGMGIIFPTLGPLFMGSTDGILSAGASVAERQFWYGATLVAWSILMFIGAPFLGDLSDRIGRKKVL